MRHVLWVVSHRLRKTVRVVVYVQDSCSENTHQDGLLTSRDIKLADHGQWQQSCSEIGNDVDRGIGIPMFTFSSVTCNNRDSTTIR